MTQGSKGVRQGTAEKGKAAGQSKRTRRRFGALRLLPSDRWQASYTGPDGRRHMATRTFPTKASAEHHLAGVETDMDRGAWMDPRAGQVTFGEWAKLWLRADPTKRATTLARDESVLQTHFLPTLGSYKLATITPLNVRRCVEAMTAKLAPATVRTNYGVFRAALSAAVEADLIVRSPCRGIKLPAAQKRQRPTLTPDELAHLAAELPERYRLAVWLAGVLGLRWSEVAGLRVGRVNLLARTITVTETMAEVGGRLTPVATTKSQAGCRTLVMPEFLVAMIAEHLAKMGLTAANREALVITGPKGGALRRSFEGRHFLPAAQRAGLENLTFHGLRHVAASFLVEDDEHPRVIQHRLGHATARLSMELYSHVPEPADRAAAENLEARFRGPSRTPVARPGSQEA